MNILIFPFILLVLFGLPVLILSQKYKYLRKHTEFKRRYSSFKTKARVLHLFIGLVSIVLLPGLLVIDHPYLLRWFLLYVLAISPLVLTTTFLISTKKLPLQSFISIIVVIATLLPAFIILAAYPFHLLDLLFIIALALLGASMPFLSRRATLYLYSLGGRTPLPPQHRWLNGEIPPSNSSDNRYTEYVKSAGGIGLGIGWIIYYLIKFIIKEPVTETVFILLILKLLSLVVIVGLSLTLGVTFRKGKRI